MLDEKEGVLLTELDLDYEEQVREELPLLKAPARSQKLARDAHREVCRRR